jgi:hypothetical protein
LPSACTLWPLESCCQKKKLEKFYIFQEIAIFSCRSMYSIFMHKSRRDYTADVITNKTFPYQCSQ